VCKGPRNFTREFARPYFPVQELMMEEGGGGG